MASTPTSTTTATGQKEQGRQDSARGNEAGQTRQAGQQGQQGQQGRQGQQQSPARREGSRQDNRMARRDSPTLMSPFTMLQRFFTGDIFNALDSATQGGGSNAISWVPNVDVVQEGNELVARVDLPGVDLDDVVVEVGEDAIRISGERVEERADDDGPVYRFERTYGAFYREIPLPPGAMTDQATASFNDGVLEIRMPAPPEQVSRGRRLDVSRGDESSSSGQRGQISGQSGSQTSGQSSAQSGGQSSEQSRRDSEKKESRTS